MATIAAVCPQCESQYQVDASLAGKRMRCPNSICRTVFEVKGPAAPPQPERVPLSSEKVEPPVPPPVRSIQQSGNVGEMMPLRTGEASAPPADAPLLQEKPKAPEKRAAAEKKPPETLPLLPSWQGAPPPVRGQAVEAQVPSPSVATQSDGLDFSELEEEAPSDEKFAQPGEVSDEADAPSPDPTSVVSPDVAVFQEPEAPRGARRRNLFIMLGLMLILAGLGVGAVYLIQGRRASDENERFQLALEAYQKQDYAQSVSLLQSLTRDFPDSTRRQEYRLLTELSDLRAAVHRPGGDAAEVSRSLDRVLEFLELYRNDPLLKDRHADLWQTLKHLSENLVSVAQDSFDRAALTRAKRAWSEAGKFTPPAGVSPTEAEKFLTSEFGRVDKAIQVKTFHDESIAQLRQLADNPSAQAVEAAMALIEERKLQGDEESAKVLAQMKAAHHAGIAYTPVEGGASSLPPESSDARNIALAPSSYFDKPGSTDGSSYFALARGVLYALEPERGDLRWARRLGIDSRHLPLRVLPALEHPEFVVALATDEPAVLALDGANGREIWRHPLTSPSVAPPVRVMGRLLIPMLSGRVDEIDLVTGRLRGFYELGQPMIAGGVHQRGTSLVYLPAAQTCLYVLDVAKQRCEHVLYLRHAPGSLQGLPLIVTDARATGGEGKSVDTSSLVISLARGPGVRLERYILPMEGPDTQPAETYSLSSSHSYSPHPEADRLGIAGDDGAFTLVGIKAHGKSRFYPFLPDGAVTPASSALKTPGLVAHADPQRWWVLGNGRLGQYLLGMTPKEGLRLMSEGEPGLLLGSPLHAAQAREGTKETLLFLATQVVDEPTCLASVVDLSSGKMRWQRSLGAIGQGPLRVAEGSVLLHAPHNLFRVAMPSTKDLWEIANPESVLKLDRDENTYWLPDMTSPMLFTWPNSGKGPLRLHKIDKGKVTTRNWKLPHPPLGSWTAHGNHFVIPLANGELFALGGEGDKVQKLEAWRGADVEEQLPGHVLSLNDQTFVSTDGNLTLTLWRWSEFGAAPKPVLEPKKFEQRIVAAPVKLSLKDGTAALAVVDASNRLTLLHGETLKEIGFWTLPGKLTAGPVVRGSGLLCVVGKNRLCWIEPGKTEIVGQFLGIAQIVGVPETFDDQLIAADWSGQLTWLDLKEGLPVRRTYQIQAQVVPVATPIVVEGRVLVPLSDGTWMGLQGEGKKGK